MLLHMSLCHLYLRCCYCFDLWWCLYYQVETRWIFMSKYLQMMYEQLKMINHISWVSEWIVLINYFCKDYLFPCPWCKLLLQNENMINVVKWESSTNRKRDFLNSWSKYFWGRPPTMKRVKNLKYVPFFNIPRST